MRHGRPLGDCRAGPQRPASAALLRHDGQHADPGFGNRHGAAGRKPDRGERPHRPGRDGGRRPRHRPLPQGRGDQRHAGRPPRLRRVDCARQENRPHRQDRRARARLLPGRDAAPPPARRGHDIGGARKHPAPDGGGRRGSHRQHGRRHAHRRAQRAVPRLAPLLPPELRAGHQPADRQPARNPGDESEDAARQPRQRARPGQQPMRPAAAGNAGAHERRVRGDAAHDGCLGHRGGLHLFAGRRRGGPAAGDQPRAAPRRRGRARRLHPRGADRRAPG